MSTFRGQWLNNPTREYGMAFEINAEMIKLIYGNPKAISNSVEAVENALSAPLSRYDQNTWERLDLLSVPFKELNDERKAMRIRQQIHIPDMMLINHYRCLALSEHPKDAKMAASTFTEYMTGEESPEEYSRDVWGPRLREANISREKIYFPGMPEDSGQTKKRFGVKADSSGKSSDDWGLEAEAWKAALAEWQRFVNGMNLQPSQELNDVMEEE